MAKAFSGKKPQHFGNTIRVFLNYLGRHKFMLGLVGVLTAVSALANLLGTYMIKPVVNGILETGSIPGLVRGVALTAAIYAVGALSTLGYTQTMVRADAHHDGQPRQHRETGRTIAELIGAVPIPRPFAPETDMAHAYGEPHHQRRQT